MESTLDLAVNKVIENTPGLASITLRVELPIDPVDPNMAIFFMNPYPSRKLAPQNKVPQLNDCLSCPRYLRDQEAS